MSIDLHKWTSADREALIALCNTVDRTFLSDRLPYTEADADEKRTAGSIGYMILTPPSGPRASARKPCGKSTG